MDKKRVDQLKNRKRKEREQVGEYEKKLDLYLALEKESSGYIAFI